MFFPFLVTIKSSGHFSATEENVNYLSMLLFTKLPAVGYAHGVQGLVGWHYGHDLPCHFGQLSLLLQRAHVDLALLDVPASAAVQSSSDVPVLGHLVVVGHLVLAPRRHLDLLVGEAHRVPEGKARI